MTFWLIASAFLVEIIYGLMPDAVQFDWGWTIEQLQKALLGFAAIVALNYRSPAHKGTIVLAAIWAGWVMATDWAIPKEWPSWIPAIEGAFFLAWLLWMRWRHDVVSRGQETGRPDGDDSVPPAGQGWRRGSRWG